MTRMVAAPPLNAMQLVALLLVAVIVGLLSSRFGMGSLFGPSEQAPRPSQTIQQVEKQVEASGQADQQRLDDAMKGLR
jgi:hypothetical protein